MNLLMISGDRSILQGKKGAFWYTLEELSKHFERIDVITPRESSKLQAPSSTSFPNVFFHPSPRGLWHQPSWIRQKGKELIGTHHHDVMTIHDYPPFYNGMGGMRLSKETGVPAVQEIHHIVGFPVAASLVERIGRAMSRFHIPRSSQCAAAVRCVSEDTAATLRSWGVENVHVVSSMYLDHDALQPDASIIPTFDVGCFGRLVANKGIESVIESIVQMPGKRMLIVGDGPERRNLEALTGQLGIAERVTFRGWAPTNADLYRAMQEVRVVVVNSSSEGGPRVALEAMALGCPLVTTHVGIMPEVVDDGRNALFTTGHPDDLTQKLGMLLGDDALRTQIGSAARAILDRFERKKLIGKYAAFLKGIATSAPSVPSAPSLLFITQKLHQQDAFTVQWVRAFIARGYAVTVLCLENRLRPEDHPDFAVHSLGKERGTGKIAQVLRFWKLIMALRYDRVFIHMAPVWYALGWKWWLLKHTPVYLWYTHYKMQLGVLLFGWFGNRFFCATEQSLPQYAAATDENPRAKKVVTGHGIDLSTWTKRPNVCVDGKQLLVVHRLSRSKRLEIVLRALTLLPGCTLDIYGIEAEPDYVAEMKALTKELALDDRVIFHGTVPSQRLPEIYASHRLLLNMASETIDKTMLEAMTCGCYPVTTARNAEAIGLHSLSESSVRQVGLEHAPKDDTPEAVSEFVRTHLHRAPLDADAMFTIVATRHSLAELVEWMDLYIRPGT